MNDALRDALGAARPFVAGCATFSRGGEHASTVLQQIDAALASSGWRSDMENAPKDRPFLVAMRDPKGIREDVEYHVAKYIGSNKKTLIIGNAFSFDHTGEISAWSEIDPAVADTRPHDSAGSTPPAGFSAPTTPDPKP